MQRVPRLHIADGYKKSMISENHPVQNTNETESYLLLYVADNCEASEIRELYAAKRLTSY
jgi:hypothetical protein